MKYSSEPELDGALFFKLRTHFVCCMYSYILHCSQVSQLCLIYKNYICHVQIENYVT